MFLVSFLLIALYTALSLRYLLNGYYPQIWATGNANGAYSYNLNNLNSLIEFDKLLVNEYNPITLFKIEIIVNFVNGTTPDVHEYNLYVYTASTVPALPSLPHPSTIIQGQDWPVYGEVRNTGNITKVWVGVYPTASDAPGDYLVGVSDTMSVHSHVKAYNLQIIGSQMGFIFLPRGTYYYKVTVEIGNGRLFTYVNAPFTVV